MRIDRWLHLNGYFESRSRAKLAVKKGLVLVNGRKVKPSYDVRGDEVVQVLAESRPAGYYKLMELDRAWNIFSEVDVVLDLGSSAGGFLAYAAERANRVIGIEFSTEFREQLQKVQEEFDNVEVIIGDVFKLDISAMPEFDVVLVDLTLEPEDSLRALLRFSSKVKPGGKVLFVSKDRRADVPEIFEVVKERRSEEKREWYFLLRMRG
ncbi:SAM-dependent methyltransferase [Geoglobus sp.]